MDIYLVAKLKKYDDFISCYNEGDAIYRMGIRERMHCSHSN